MSRKGQPKKDRVVVNGKLSCTKCGVPKPIACFLIKGKTGSRYKPYCRSCEAAYHRDHYQKNKNVYRENKKAFILETKKHVLRYLLQHPCSDCGEKDPIVLDFDHNDPSSKKEGVSNLVRNGLSIARVDKEIAKCTVRCSNCHRRRTAKQFSWGVVSLT